MPKNNVTRLALTQHDGTLWTPEDALQDTIDDLSNGLAIANKIVIILLNDEDGKFDTSIIQAGMEMTEVIALLEVIKHDVIMNLLEGD